MWNCSEDRAGNPISERIFLKPKRRHPTPLQPSSTLLPAANCLCPILCAKNIFLGGQQVCSQTGEGRGLQSESEGEWGVYLGEVWAAA